MDTLEFSLTPREPVLIEQLTHYMNEFRERRSVDVAFKFYEWSELWSVLRSIALKREGPGISEVGSTWVGSFMGMNALRSFSPSEVAHIVASNDIIPAAWETTTFRGDNQVWSIPWQVDSRVVLYWRDMLEDAGIDEATAFSTPDHMEETFERLMANGVETPWLEGTDATNDSVYHAAIWIWAMGGDYISDDGRMTLLDTPEVLAGLNHYFGLYRYMPKMDTLLHPYAAGNLFAERKAAAIISGTWTLNSIKARSPHLIDYLGAALPPGPPFVGGTSLVIWRHISPRMENHALELLRLLLSYEVQYEISQRTGTLMPSRLDALNAMDNYIFPQHSVFVEAIRVGRSMPAISIWSIVEERLASTLKRIWSNILQDPSRPFTEIIAEHLEPLARRLDRTLAQVKD